MSKKILSVFKNLEQQVENIENTLFLITSEVNRFYLTDFSSSAGYLILTKSESYLVLDARYYVAALGKVDGVKVVLSKNFDETLLNITNKYGIRRVFVETNHVTLKLATKIKNTLLKAKNCSLTEDDSLDVALEKARAKKTKIELEKIKKAQLITHESFNRTLGSIRPGLTELEIAKEFEFLAKKLGASSVSFESIVASGVNSSYPHSKISNRKIGKKDVILLDVGVNFEGYMSDMSRTVFIGESSKKQKEVYKLVLEAQDLAFSKIKPGVKCCEIDNAVRNFIDATKYKGCFLHSTGHGVGLNIHEKPYISHNSEDVLEPGMIFTIEPGIYIEGEFGVRIEDMVLVTENGYENLTSTNKEIIAQ